MGFPSCVLMFAMCPAVVQAAVTWTPNASSCEAESCMVSPTDCGKRPECQGCGSLCFDRDPAATGYDLFLESTGLSLQTSAKTVWDGELAGGGGICGGGGLKKCRRGSGNLTVAKWHAGSKQAASRAACCDACGKTSGCVAWQLITKAGTSDTQCWAMATTSVKDGPDSCESGELPKSAPLDGVLKSADVVLKWRAVQPNPPPAPIDWSALDGALDRAHAHGGKLMMLLWAGADWAPDWLYSHGVEKVAERKDGSAAVPNYLNPKYQQYLKAVHLDLAKQLRSKRPNSSAFIALQPCLGSTGDDTPLHEGPAYKILNDKMLADIKSQWSPWYQNMSLWLYSEALAKEIQAKELVLLINAQGDSFPLDWVAKHLPSSFLKFGQTGHEYQSNYERYRAAEYAPFIYSLQNGRPIRSRAELSGETCWVHGSPVCNPPQKQHWNFYAMSMFVASAHLDYWNVQPEAASGILNDTAWAPIWRLLDRYSGVRWPRQSPGAWIAFRDGLDVMDTDRFSVAEHGELTLKSQWWLKFGYPQISTSSTNVKRAKSICASHADQGCTIDDEAHLLAGPMNQRHVVGMNDVAFGNWRGDYGNFMRLLDPHRNSRGWWRVGPPEEFFGRFARGFADPKSSVAVLPLALDRGLWGGLPLSRTQPLVVRLVFLDAGSGFFTINYDAQSGSTELLRVQKRGSGSWREVCSTIPDAHFGGRGPGGSDLWLTNADKEDDIFDSIEIANATVNEISLKGCDGDPLSYLV